MYSSSFLLFYRASESTCRYVVSFAWSLLSGVMLVSQQNNNKRHNVCALISHVDIWLLRFLVNIHSLSQVYPYQQTSWDPQPKKIYSTAWSRKLHFQNMSVWRIFILQVSKYYFNKNKKDISIIFSNTLYILLFKPTTKLFKNRAIIRNPPAPNENNIKYSS